MMSCVDELGLFAAVWLLIGDVKGCRVPGKFIGLATVSGCVVKFMLLHSGADCCEFQLMVGLIPLEFQLIGLPLACIAGALSVGDITNCDCI